MCTAPTYLHLQSNCKYITQPFSSSYIRGTRCRKSESMVLWKARTRHRWRGRLCRHLHWRLGLWCLRWSSSLVPVGVEAVIEVFFPGFWMLVVSTYKKRKLDYNTRKFLGFRCSWFQSWNHNHHVRQHHHHHLLLLLLHPFQNEYITLTRAMSQFENWWDAHMPVAKVDSLVAPLESWRDGSPRSGRPSPWGWWKTLEYLRSNSYNWLWLAGYNTQYISTLPFQLLRDFVHGQ